MTAPFIVIRTFTIKEGQLEGFKRFLREFFKIIETKELRLLAINLRQRGRHRGDFRALPWSITRRSPMSIPSGPAGNSWTPLRASMSTASPAMPSWRRQNTWRERGFL
jgi:hypothetical protein